MALAVSNRECKQALERLRCRSHFVADAEREANAEPSSSGRTLDVADDCAAVLTPDHEIVLKALARTPHRCVQVSRLAAVGPIRNRETVGTLLKEMECMALVHRPFGIRKGYALTKRGVARVRLLAA